MANFLLKRSGTASKRPTASSMALGEVDINYDASTGGLFYKDSSGNVVKVGPTQVGSTAPNSSPAGSAGNSAGELWFDTSVNALKVWNGSAWVNTLANTAVTPGSYTNSSITVDALGRLTAASSGPAPILCSTITAKGNLIAGTAASTPTALPVGTNGQMLYADSTCTTGIKWAAPPADIPCSALTAKGTIVTATAASTPASLLVGTNGQVLTANSACAAGIQWATPVVAYGLFCRPATGCVGTGVGTVYCTLALTNDIAICNMSRVNGVITFCCSGMYNVSVLATACPIAFTSGDATVFMTATCNATSLPRSGYRSSEVGTSSTLCILSFSYSFLQPMLVGDTLTFCTSSCAIAANWGQAAPSLATAGPQISIHYVGP